MHRDKVLYHFRRKQTSLIVVARDRPSPYGASRDYRGEGGASLPRPTGKWKISPDVLTDETAVPIHRAPSQQ